MGVTRAAHIQAGLLAAGMAASTPVAIIERSSGPDERTLVTQLDALRAPVAGEAVRSPAILIIGEVVAHRCASLARPHAEKPPPGASLAEARLNLAR